MKDLIRNLIRYNIDFQEYIFLYSAYLKSNELVTLYDTVESYRETLSIQQLIHKGYIARKTLKQGNKAFTDYVENNLEITNKGIAVIEDFLNGSISESLPKNEPLMKYKVNWIEDWYNLFPKGIKSGGYYVRTSIKDCDNKMSKFIKENPEFTKDIILESTKIYVEQMKVNNYSMMKLAPNFIQKDGISMLSGCCEAYVEGVNNNQETYGPNEDTFTIKV